MAALPVIGGPDLRVFVIQGSIRGYVKDTNHVSTRLSSVYLKMVQYFVNDCV